MKEYDMNYNTSECSAEVEGLVELRRAAEAATGDPSRYPRRGVIDRYQSEVVAAYESGDLVAATVLTAQQADNEQLRAVAPLDRENWEDYRNALARAEKAEAERDELISVISDEISRSRRHLSAATLAAYAKLKGGV